MGRHVYNKTQWFYSKAHLFSEFPKSAFWFVAIPTKAMQSAFFSGFYRPQRPGKPAFA
jgi:hypothetical protein